MDADTIFPSLFLAHGSPMLALDGEAWGTALGTFGRALPRPRAILVCSAHWENHGPFLLSSSPRPGVMHDFGGFPSELYTLDYPAPGGPEWAARAAALLVEAGFEAALDPQRPLDHGAWVPLRALAPEADIPVVQLSLPRPRSPQMLLDAGRALAPLRREGVLIVGSGGIVHNLGRLEWPGSSAPQVWASGFQSWIHEQLAAGTFQAMTDWRAAPGARESVPTSEHLDPLFLAAGAGEGPASLLFEGWQLDNLSLASYCFP